MPLLVPFVSQSWVPWVASWPTKKSSPLIATGADMTVGAKLMGVAVRSWRPSRFSTLRPNLILRLDVAFAEGQRFVGRENMGCLRQVGGRPSQRGFVGAFRQSGECFAPGVSPGSSKHPSFLWQSRPIWHGPIGTPRTLGAGTLCPGALPGPSIIHRSC